MRIVTEFPRAIVEHPDMGIVMPDGCRLSARVWMPADAATNPVPAVLEYIPYRKRDGTLPRDELMHTYVAGHGYACVRVDMRGTGDSEGQLTDEYTPQELSDACAVIAWLAAQPWCSGAVGMMGKSWGGFNCLQTAFLRPPALRAIISVYSTTDRFADDIHFRGGCLLGENLGWGAVMLSYSSRPADPELRADWREDWLARLDSDRFLAPLWASHQRRDSYWKHGSVREDWAAVQVPVLSVSGWADSYMNTTAKLLENMVAPVKGIIGPWVHQYPHTAVPGPRIGFLQEALRWWDHWLKGIDTGVQADPALRVYMQHSQAPDASAPHRAGHWLTEAVWPSARITQRDLPLSPGGVLGGSGGELGVPIATSQQLGLTAGEFFPMGLNAEMAGDQAQDDALSVCFDAQPQADALALLGAAVLKLRLTSNRPLAFLVARLCDVAPDGSSTRIAHGMLNLCHRDSMEEPSPVPIDLPFDITLMLDQMAYRLSSGHHLRLAFSTTYWPFIWPSPQAATLTLLQGSLALPMHQGGATDEWAPPPSEMAQPWRHKVHQPASASRRVERDLITGTVTLVVEDDQGKTENLTHGMTVAEKMAERWSVHPDDPLSAQATIRWEQNLSRGDWGVKTVAEAEMTATATDLCFRARLRAWEKGDTLIFDRDFVETVPRDFV